MFKKILKYGLALFAAILLMEVYRFYMPDNIDDAINYKAYHLTLRGYSYLAKLKEALGYGTEPANMRHLMTYLHKQNLTNDEYVSIENRKINDVNVRIYKQTCDVVKKTPVIVFFHGGEYWNGNLDSYDLYLSEFVKRLNISVISVEYRLTPEFPYSISIDDCYSVVWYVMNNAAELGIDKHRLALLGDSAGGNAVAALSQRMLKMPIVLKQLFPQPKLQLLIYPWVQMVTSKLPSSVHYSHTGIADATRVDFQKLVPWYLGIVNITDDVRQIFRDNLVISLVDDTSLQTTIVSYLDPRKIPDMYKTNKSYYDTTNVEYPPVLPESSVLHSDVEMRRLFEKLHEPKLSPLLADKNDLTGLPITYIQSVEWDSIKDEGLLYAERLKEAGVKVKVDYYEKAFHGIVNLIQDNSGFQQARIMQNDLIKFIKENL